MVLMLAVIHHFIVTERVPLSEIIGLVADLTSRYVILEFVSAQDPMFKRLARGRDELHKDFTQERFEAECRSFFDIRKVCRYESPTRCLYLLERR